MRQNGFTIVELVIVILIVGIIAAAAIPRVADIYNESLIKHEEYTAGAVRTGIGTYYLAGAAQNQGVGTFPDHLDLAAQGDASPSNLLFTNVIQLGVKNQWTKTGSDKYKGPTGREYLYDPVNGLFSLTLGGSGKLVGKVYDKPQYFSVTPTNSEIYNLADKIGCDRDTLYGIYSFLTTYPEWQTAVTYFSLTDGAGGWIQWNARIIGGKFILQGGNIVAH